MDLIVQPVETDLTHHVFFEEPQLEFSKEDNRLRFLGNLLETFDLRLNDIKIKQNFPSNNIYHFSKFYGRAFLDVSLGYEEYRAQLRNPYDKEQASTLFGKLAQLFKSIPIKEQRVVAQQHLSTDGNATSHLNSLNPSCPENFKDILEQSGVHYKLKIPSHELTINITLVGSIFIEGGIYLDEAMFFSPNLYDFDEALDVSVEYHNLILKELGLVIEDNR